MSCSTHSERMAKNKETPCEEPFRPVFPKWMVGSVTPGILFLGMTIIGYGLGTGKKWAISDFIKPSTQLSIMLLLMVVDHGSSYWDHSRVSNEDYCLTSMFETDLDTTTARTGFGALAAALAGVSVYGMKSGSITLSATGIPFATMMGYLAWSPQKFQSCKNNAMFTGIMAFGLDVMTLVGIMEVLFAASGNNDTSWHKFTNLYVVVISALFVALIGKYSDYGDRISEGSCEIDDEKDLEEEKEINRKPELYNGLMFSFASIIYIVYLKMKFTEVSCCAAYPTLIYLVFDILTKLQVWKRGDPLTGDNLHRSIVYVMVQVLDILLSSSSMISVMVDKNIIGKTIVPGEPLGLVKNVAHFVGGSLTYMFNVVKLLVYIILGKGEPAGVGSMARMAEVVKSISLNVLANLIPLSIDSTNATYMLEARPQTDLNVKCFVQ